VPHLLLFSDTFNVGSGANGAADSAVAVKRANTIEQARVRMAEYGIAACNLMHNLQNFS
jgi:hypothetical protein